MRWERRKPLWPIVAALGLLFVLALAAPGLWEDVDARLHRLDHVDDLVEDVVVDVGIDVIVPQQPASPLIADTIPQPPAPPAAPVVKPAKPEPLPARRQFDWQVLLEVRNQLLAVVDQLPPVQWPMPEPDSALPSAQAKVKPPAARVRVSSPNDRLAMLPSRAPITTPPVEVPREVGPMEVTDADAANFAAILLEASRRREPTPRPAATVPTIPR